MPNDTRPYVCSIIPPAMLKHMLNDPAHREAALHTLVTTQRLLGRRDVHQLQAAPAVEQMGQEYRSIFDCRGTEWLPGRLAWREGSPAAADRQTKEAAEYADAVYQFYHKVFGRTSIDGRGMRLIGTVRYSRLFCNAFWDGRQMVYGDGDGVLFNRFTASVDVVGHEMTHGVVQYVGGLNYEGQPGALNESCADVFGSMVKQFRLGQDAGQADWLIGAELLAPGVKGKGIRNLLEPGTAYDDPRLGKDPQPAHMKDFSHDPSDNGSVHVNSGIVNKAFSTAALAIGGKSWEGAGQAWWRALTTLGNPSADFALFAKATVRAAGEIFGQGSKQQMEVQAGWAAVGVA